MADEESGIIRYDTPRGEITLTIKIVRQFFCPKATDLEALAFAGYCKHTGLNPFLREVYLVKYDEAEPASMIVAYQSFMKRAERAEGYGGFRAGIVIIPDLDEPPPPLVEGDKDVPGIPAPFIALEGTLVPPGWRLAGGWCVVTRAGRPPVVATVRLEEYLQRRRDGKPTRTWERMPATMIRKVPIGQAHRDAWPDELAGLVLEEEGGARIGEVETEPEDTDLMPRRAGPSPGPEPPPGTGELVVDSAVPAGDGGGESDPPPAPAPLELSPTSPSLERAIFTIGTREYRTAGIGREAMLGLFELHTRLDKKLKGANPAKAILTKEFGVTHRKDLTAEAAERYTIRLKEVLGET